jgi:DENN domain-containing protein 11/Domain of unknown function (DUF4484)
MTFPDLITTFGPLIFALYRAALCRKRILFLAPPPVERTCHFGTINFKDKLTTVYNTSVLATIPPSVSSLLPNEPNRLRTLFNIGINDIRLLEQLSQESIDLSTPLESQVSEQGWVACTTDTILALKPHLYDLLITIPPQPLFLPTLKVSASTHHPVITSSDGTLVKPTFRDLRRWKRLRIELPLPIPGPDPDFDELVYQRTWTEFVCGGLFWWATAGEASQGSYVDEFTNEDDYLLNETSISRRGTLGEGVPLLVRSDTSDSVIGFGTVGRSETVLSRMRGNGVEADVGVMVYFHRMTARLLSSLSAIVEGNELEGDGGEGGEGTMHVGVEDVARMGLDWIERDFVTEMCRVWFGRDVVFNKTRSDCCY